MSRIKKYDEFMRGKGLMRFMDQIEIRGTKKGGIFSRSKNFEVHVFFTPIKKVIVDIKSNIPLTELGLSDLNGKHIDIIRRWVVENDHEITIEINR
jgi:hypothetical protein